MTSPSVRTAPTVTPGGVSPGAASPGGVAPGAVFPLRVLTQDETFSAAVSVIRHNPRAVLGLPLIASLVTFVMSMIAMVVFPSDAMLRFITDPAVFEQDTELALAAMNEVGLWVLLFASSALGTFLLLITFGLLAIPALRSAYGLPTTMGQVLRLRARTIGWLALHMLMLSLLAVVIMVVAGMVAFLVIVLTFFVGAIVMLPASFLLLCWLTAGLMFGPLVVVVERRNAFSAIARSWQLNRGSWWRHIGAVALLYLVGGIALIAASIPAAILSTLGAEAAWRSADDQLTWVAVTITALSYLYDALLSAVLTAVVASVAAMLYLNARYRREALDVALLMIAAETDPDTSRLIPGSPEHVGRLAAGGHQHV